MLGRTRISFAESIETTWQSEKASVDRVTVSAGESDVLLRFIEKRRSFIDDYYRRSLRNTISRVGDTGGE